MGSVLMIHCFDTGSAAEEPHHRSVSALSPPVSACVYGRGDIKRIQAAKRERRKRKKEKERWNEREESKKWVEQKEKSRIYRRTYTQVD